MSSPVQLAVAYAEAVARLVADPSTAEDTYYPAIVALWRGLLDARGLKLDVRANTVQQRASGTGRDRPDVAVYDNADAPVVLGEVKLPAEDIEAMAVSVERNDQIGRYLASSNVVLLCNVRCVGLLTRKPGVAVTPGEPIPPGGRHLEQVVDLWASRAAMRGHKAITAEAIAALADLLEHAITDFAVLREPQVLARVFARLARKSLEDLPATFASVRPLLDDYEKGLGLSFNEKRGEGFFRSSLIQTAFYGLFSAWTVWATERPGEAFDWRRAGDYLRVPFLKDLFHDFSHPTRLRELNIAPHLDRATEVLRKIDRDAFFARFVRQTIDTELTAQDAALTYFYEPFLEAFDPKLREELGVWYTPPAIVHYQVERIDQLLRELGCAEGFADESVVVLDPCCGTGAYLLAVLRRIARTVRARDEDEGKLVAAEVQKAITSRVIGFEILTAPFVVAHMQIALLLSDLGLPRKESVRPRVILTNALTGWKDDPELKFNFPEIQDEHDLARKVKAGARIVVILGNPPYNAFAGAAMDEEADLVDHYKGVTRHAKLDRQGAIVREDGRKVFVPDGESRLSSVWGVRKHKLDDLYVRFFRLAEERIGEHAAFGVASFISNSSFLTGKSHPIMRESLLKTFDDIWIDNMNGDKYRTGKVIPAGVSGAGTSDQSAFSTAEDARGIQVGTAITTMVKRRDHTGPARVHVRDFWGRALAKRQALVDSLTMDRKTLVWREAQARTSEGPRPYVSITPTKASWFRFASNASGEGYEDWPAIKELFPESFQGVNHNRGLRQSIIDQDRERLSRNMKVYFTAGDIGEVRAVLPDLMKARTRYDPETVWRGLQRTARFEDDQVVQYLLFPFDQRWIYYEPSAKLLNERRPEYWNNLKGNEFFFATCARQVSEALPLYAKTLADLHLHDVGTVCFPRAVRMGGLITTPQANIPESLWRKLASAWDLVGERTSAAAVALVGQLFRVALAVMHAPDYGEDHASALTQDWAHLPIPRDRGAFDALVALGDRVATLLDPSADATAVIKDAMKPLAPATLARMVRTDGGTILPEGEPLTVAYFGGAPGRWVERPYKENEAHAEAWGKATGDLGINESFHFTNVPKAVWEYELGGYPVLKKWLGYRHVKEREGAPLTLDELRWFQQIVRRVAALLALGPRLDEAYALAVPGAFSAEELGVRAP